MSAQPEIVDEFWPTCEQNENTANDRITDFHMYMSITPLLSIYANRPKFADKAIKIIELCGIQHDVQRSNHFCAEHLNLSRVALLLLWSTRFLFAHQLQTITAMTVGGMNNSTIFIHYICNL